MIFPKGCVAPTGTRDSTLKILVGDNGWVNHCENGILYSFNATKCMFSWGNLSEKLHMARLDCTDEVIVDLFAGIGYFVLPFLVRYNVIIIILVLHYCLRRRSLVKSRVFFESLSYTKMLLM